MTKFLNKKEQVIDLKLTTYGHYLMSIGTFKPVYYAFFDNNIIYDIEWARGNETQNDIFDRIKHETPYIEGQTLFEDLENRKSNAEGTGTKSWFELDITPTKEIVRPNLFRYDKAIGDAHLSGRQLDLDAAWKIVLLNGQIVNVRDKDTINDLNVPQVDIELYYKKQVTDGDMGVDESEAYGILDQTSTFADGKVVAMKADDAVIYVEEKNTDILTQNFDIEIFEIVRNWEPLGNTGDLQEVTSSFKRKYYDKEIPQIVDGMMMMPRQIMKTHEQIPSSSVEYYFDVYTDAEVDRVVACENMTKYNKQSYYVDLDLDCEGLEEDNTYFDIYGTGAEPEVCLD